MEIFGWLTIGIFAAVGVLVLLEYDKYALSIGMLGGVSLIISRVLTLGVQEEVALSDYVFSPAWRGLVGEEPPIDLSWMLSVAPVFKLIGYGLLAISVIWLLVTLVRHLRRTVEAVQTVDAAMSMASRLEATTKLGPERLSAILHQVPSPEDWDAKRRFSNYFTRRRIRTPKQYGVPEFRFLDED